MDGDDLGVFVEEKVEVVLGYHSEQEWSGFWKKKWLNSESLPC